MANSGGPGWRGVRWYEPSPDWPPPKTPDDVHRVVQVDFYEHGFRLGRPVTGRVVKLWGQTVVINDAGDAYCDYCFQFIPVSELVAADNGHNVGLRRIPGASLPLPDDEDGRGGAFFR